MKTRIIINDKYRELEESISKIPHDFNQIGETIYSGRNTLKIIDIENVSINVKAFQKPNIINRFVYGNFRKSKAQRSFEYATILLERNINTPEPIAYIEDINGVVFNKSYYICIHEHFDGMMREFQKGSLYGRENLLDQFALFTANMHNKEVLHLDYSPGNILYKRRQNDYDFYLVDLNRMFFGYISMDLGCKSFRRLWGNKDMITYIAEKYAIYRGFDVDQCINLTLQYHNDFWIKFSKRHKGKQAYIKDN